MSEKSPDAFRTISEVAEWLGVNAHVLRFWESKFTQVKPVKRAGGRRYYRRADMELLGGIQRLLHEEGMTIKGVQKVLRDQGIKAVSALSKPLDDDDSPPPQDTSGTDAPMPLHPAETTPEPKPAQTMPLFSHHAAPEAAEPAAPRAAEQTPESEPGRAAPAPLAPEAKLPAPEPVAEAAIEPPAASAAEAPPRVPQEKIAPLPAQDIPLTEAIQRLAPYQIPPGLLAPIHARLVALRERMDSGA